MWLLEMTLGGLYKCISSVHICGFGLKSNLYYKLEIDS